ncbi:hypothetical protein JW887_06520 [Candidatus Dojkabacteria bacterium]|nr:hypothetical protein [Candidatus Dojkabacteria bacterium]
MKRLLVSLFLVFFLLSNVCTEVLAQEEPPVPSVVIFLSEFELYETKLKEVRVYYATDGAFMGGTNTHIWIHGCEETIAEITVSYFAGEIGVIHESVKYENLWAVQIVQNTKPSDFSEFNWLTVEEQYPTARSWVNSQHIQCNDSRKKPPMPIPGPGNKLDRFSEEDFDKLQKWLDQTPQVKEPIDVPVEVPDEVPVLNFRFVLWFVPPVFLVLIFFGLRKLTRPAS